MNQIKHYGYINALRGYAILLVIAIHSAGAATITGPFRTIVDQGARGVQLFFVASALTLVMSWNSRNDGVLNFYIRRIFRIAPLFWLAILGYLCISGLGPQYYAPNGLSAFHILTTATFLHGFHPETINSVVPGGWSIAVEMMFYLIFPILLVFIRGWKSALAALGIAIYIVGKVTPWLMANSKIIWPNTPDYLLGMVVHFGLLSQLPVFLMGFVTYFAVLAIPKDMPKIALESGLILAILAGCALAFKQNPINIPKLGIDVSGATSYGICFGAAAFCMAKGAGKWLCNKIIEQIGIVSFSAYLWHFSILSSYSFVKTQGIDLLPDFLGKGILFFAVFYTLVVSVTIAVSSITFKYIEQPMNRLGHLFIQRRKALQLASQVKTM